MAELVAEFVWNFAVAEFVWGFAVAEFVWDFAVAELEIEVVCDLAVAEFV